MALLDTLYQDILRARAKDDFGCFCEYVIKEEGSVNTEGEHSLIDPQDFHVEWYGMLQSLVNPIPSVLTDEEQLEIYQKKHLLLFSPSDTGKSITFSLAFPLWLLGNDSNKRIAIISNSADRAERLLLGIKTYILQSKELHDIFPNLKPMVTQGQEDKRSRESQWKVEMITVDRSSMSRDSSILSCGIRSKSITGSRYDVMIYDDILSYDVNMGDLELERGITWYNNQAQHRLVKGGLGICVGTAWSPKDLLHYLAKQSEWVTYRYSMEESDKSEGFHYVSWPERHPQERLNIEKKRDFVSFNRNRRSRATATEELIFGQDLDKTAKRDYTPLEVREWETYIGVDLSTAKRKGTTINVVGVRPDSKLKVVLDVDAGAWDPSEKSERIRDFAYLYKPDIILVENNSQQEDIVQMLTADNISLPIDSITTGRNKNALINTLSIEIRNGLWRLNMPECTRDLASTGVGTCDCNWCRFYAEANGYPNYISDDMVMSWLFSAEASRAHSYEGEIIRIIDLDDDSDEPIENLMPKFSFADYEITNWFSHKNGFKPKPGYEAIARWFKFHPEANVGECPLEEYERTDIKIVFDDMVRYCRTMNEGA